MVDQRISELTELVSISNGDLFIVVEDLGVSYGDSKSYDVTPLVDAIDKKHTRSHSIDGSDDHASMTADRIVGRVTSAGTPQQLTAAQVNTLLGIGTQPSGAVVGTTDTQTLTNKTLTDPALVGCPLEDVYTITDGAAFEIDPSNGTIQLITLGASRTPKATNFANGEAITLLVADGTDYTITWTDATLNVHWFTDGGSNPTLNTSGYTSIVLFKAGNQIYGARVGDN